MIFYRKAITDHNIERVTSLKAQVKYTCGEYTYANKNIFD